LSKTE